MRVHILLGWILNPARPRGSNRSDKITHYVTAVAERKRDKNVAHVKYWEIVADNLSKASFSWAVSQRLIPGGERCGSQTHTATNPSVSMQPARDYPSLLPRF